MAMSLLREFHCVADYRPRPPGEGMGHIMNTPRPVTDKGRKDGHRGPSFAVRSSSYTQELGQRQVRLAVVKSGRLRALVLSLGCLLLGIAMPALHLAT
jgi:hypothetical protein